MSDRKGCRLTVRPRGRPRVKEPADSSFSACLTQREHDALIQLAQRDRASSVSGYGRRIIVLHLQQAGVLPTD